MVLMQRVDALEAGFRFMTWVFSKGEAFGEDVRAFMSRIGLNWADVEHARTEEDGTVGLIKRIEESSRPDGPHAFAWFEVGRNTIFLSNMAGTGAPPALVDAAMAGYRRCLEDAQLRIEERDKLEALLRGLADGSMRQRRRRSASSERGFGIKRWLKMKGKGKCRPRSRITRGCQGPSICSL